MLILSEEQVSQAVAGLAQEADCDLPRDVEKALAEACAAETDPRGREVLAMLMENAEIARRERLPICQDTGMFNVYIALGPDVATGGSLQQAVDAGIAAATRAGGLRPSIVAKPLAQRVNTGDNTPAFLYLESCAEPGAARITVMPKGGGSENVTVLRMMLPTATPGQVRDAVLDIVREKAPFACPPVIVGVGIGSNADGALHMAKRALLRDVGTAHPDEEYAELERAILGDVNGLGIGPGGLGGDTTALGVMVERAATHIACLPLAVAISCHALRRKSATL